MSYDERRRRYFTKELYNALKILEQGHINVIDFKGSWAGAMGQNQFMPSSFLNYAQDFNNDGKKDGTYKYLMNRRNAVKKAIAKKRGKVKEGFSAWRIELDFNEQVKK